MKGIFVSFALIARRTIRLKRNSEVILSRELMVRGVGDNQFP